MSNKASCEAVRGSAESDSFSQLWAELGRALELSHVGLATVVDVSVTESRVMAGMPQSSRKAAESPPCRLKAEAAAPC